MDKQKTEWPDEKHIESVGQNGGTLEDEGKVLMGELMALADIRQVIGDPHGKLTQDEVVERVRGLAVECEQHHVSIIELNEKIRSVLTQRDELAAQNSRLLSLLNEHFVEWEKDSGEWNEFDWHDRVAVAIAEKPAASLAEIRIAAVNGFADKVWKQVMRHYRTIKVFPLTMANQYEERTRQEIQHEE
ncbi:hypothetical protein GCM10022421_32450 [Oceanisphaera sediminis]|uniref:Uncharacterized protein n=1 Tax=Oceanisphaera sediminis TaxID=981381 RepID=A0ABP7ENN8_9GAMM